MKTFHPFNCEIFERKTVCYMEVEFPEDEIEIKPQFQGIIEKIYR